MSATPPAESTDFPLARDDLWFRIQRALRLIPADGGDGVIRRMMLFPLIAWLPLVVWAVATGHAIDSETGEPLLRHLGIHVRFLVALPLLILGERLARGVMAKLLPRFIQRNLVTEEKEPAFRQVIADTARLKNSTLPWIAIGGVILLIVLLPGSGQFLDELDWAREDGKLGAGGWWYLAVSRPLFQVFLFGWLWRIVLLGVLLKRIAGIGLDLVPTHPDRLGGMGFISSFPRVFMPLALATSCILAAHWAHEILWHGAHVTAFKMQGVTFLVVIVLLCLAPLAVFMKALKRARGRALGEYSLLIGRHGRMVHDKWIAGSPPEDEALLDAPELGCTADINAIYGEVVAMKKHPFTKLSLIPILVAAALPLLVVTAIDLPLGELLGKLLKILV